MGAAHPYAGKKGMMETINCFICGRKLIGIDYVKPNPINEVQFLCKAHTHENVPGDDYHRKIVLNGKECMVNCIPENDTCFMITTIGKRLYQHIGDCRNGSASYTLVKYIFDDDQRESIKEIYMHSAHNPVAGEYSETTKVV